MEVGAVVAKLVRFNDTVTEPAGTAVVERIWIVGVDDVEWLIFIE